MNRANGEDPRGRKGKADADAFALLSALGNRGRLAPLPPGTIVQGKYRVERHLRSADMRNQYLVSWDDQAGGYLCWECGYEQNAPDDERCRECDSELGGRQFILSERWRVNFQPYLDSNEQGRGSSIPVSPGSTRSSRTRSGFSASPSSSKAASSPRWAAPSRSTTCATSG
jgi:hypothetical protein